MNALAQPTAAEITSRSKGNAAQAIQKARAALQNASSTGNAILALLNDPVVDPVQLAAALSAGSPSTTVSALTAIANALIALSN